MHSGDNFIGKNKLFEDEQQRKYVEKTEQERGYIYIGS